MRILHYIILLIALGILSCATGSAKDNKTASVARYRFDIKDRPDQERFVIILVSLDDRSLCLGFDEWPNEAGELDTGSQRATLETSKHVYPAANANFGYCIGEACIIKIKPGATLTGYIGYKQFGDPKIVASWPHRRLHFSVSPRVCIPRDYPTGPR